MNGTPRCAGWRFQFVFTKTLQNRQHCPHPGHTGPPRPRCGAPHSREGPQPRWTLVSWLESQRLSGCATSPRKHPACLLLTCGSPVVTHAAEGSLPPQPLRLLNTDEQLPSVINHGPTAEILMIVNNAVGNIFVCLDFLLLSGYSRGCVFIRDQGSGMDPLVGGLGTTLASFMAGGVVL